MNKWGVVVKAEKVIESCETVEQLTVATRYVKLVEYLFNKNEDDFDGKTPTIHDLYYTLNNKYMAIKENKFWDNHKHCIYLDDEIDRIINPTIKKEVIE